jgi:putative restriction endonuclease
MVGETKCQRGKESILRVHERSIARGYDLLFSFVDTRIAAIGVAESYCSESPKPAEFGETGQNWENVGWKIKVRFAPLFNKVRLKDHIAVLRGVLPVRYSPLQANGNGVQSIYLSEIASDFAEVLAGLIGAEAQAFVSAAEVNAAGTSDRMMTSDDLDVWERRLEEKVASDPSLVETDREAIIRARRGQGLFKHRST